ncbi:MAG TPA: hypothetical protein QKA08_02980 [Candidatus Megaira endosymbiont of Nemacystus decipiens]|nr:hypothetical protein [Candidatus Megaera endosymbiont of Nemacystus decipiens]
MFDFIFSFANKFISFFSFSFSFFSKKSNHEADKQENKLKPAELKKEIKSAKIPIESIDNYDKDGKLLLYTYRNSEKELKYLLDNKADPNLPAIKDDITGRSVVDILLLDFIHEGFENENTKIILKLFMQHENIKLKQFTVKSFFSSMYPKTALSYPFHSACFPKIQPDVLEFICKSNPEVAKKEFEKLKRIVECYIDQKRYLNISDMVQYLENLNDQFSVINDENEQLRITGDN